MNNMKQNRKMILLGLLTSLLVSSILTSGIITAQEEEATFFDFGILVIEGFDAHKTMAEMIQNECKKIGVEVTIESVDFGIFIERLNEAGTSGALAKDDGYDSWLVQFGDSAELDPDNLGTLFHTKNAHPGWNKGGFFNGEFDAIMDEAAVLSNKTERTALYAQALAVLADELPTAPICYLKDPWVMNSDIEGFDAVLGCYGLGAYTWSLSNTTGGTIKYAQPGSLPSLNPTFAGAGTTGRAVGHTVWEALMDYDNSYNPVGELAESWTVSSDSLVWTFTLHDGILWHDGTPFTTQDILTTYDAVMDLDTALSTHYDFVEVVESYRAIDNMTFELTLNQPSASAWSKIFTQEIFPDHIMGSVPHADWKGHAINTQHSIGTGPFKLVEWRPEESVELAVNEEYYRGRANLDRIFFINIPDAATAMAALEKGDVDVLDTYYSLGNEVDAIEANEDLKYVLRINPGTVHLSFNLNHPVLNNVNVRRAISSTIPRDAIVSTVLSDLGDANRGYIHYLTWAYNEDALVPGYDITQAKAYMELAGYDYTYLEPTPITPQADTTLPMVGGLIAGIIVGALAATYLKKS